jgi:hypothetical protein
MKKNLLIFLISICYFSSFAQSDGDLTFIVRYFKLRDSYKVPVEVCASFAGSSYATMAKYMNRYYAFRDSRSKYPTFGIYYAKSENTILRFEDRIDSIARMYPDLKDSYGEFGAATRNLDQFMKRYNEIKSRYPDMKTDFAAYAGSFQKLDDFIKRYNEIRDSYPKNHEMYAEFAASSRPMDVQKVGTK